MKLLLALVLFIGSISQAQVSVIPPQLTPAAVELRARMQKMELLRAKVVASQSKIANLVRSIDIADLNSLQPYVIVSLHNGDLCRIISQGLRNVLDSMLYDVYCVDISGRTTINERVVVKAKELGL